MVYGMNESAAQKQCDSNRNRTRSRPRKQNRSARQPHSNFGQPSSKMERRPRRTCAKYGQKYHGSPAATMAHCSRTLAGFLRPPQTYELCQTAKAFHVKENGVPRATREIWRPVSKDRKVGTVDRAPRTAGVTRRTSDFDLETRGFSAKQRPHVSEPVFRPPRVPGTPRALRVAVSKGGGRAKKTHR